jgi:hypothetical protein
VRPVLGNHCLVGKLTVGRVKCQVGQGGMTLSARGFGGVLVGRGCGWLVGSAGPTLTYATSRPSGSADLVRVLLDDGRPGTKLASAWPLARQIAGGV